MGLFGNSHAKCDERLNALELEVSKLAQELRRTRAEASELAERAYRNLKKAEARARRELDEQPTNQEPTSGRPATPSEASGSRRVAWGPRARRLARLSRRDPADEADATEAENNGAPA
jgi:hypothetical protein